jgi:hypothetical protein
MNVRKIIGTIVIGLFIVIAGQISPETAQAHHICNGLSGDAYDGCIADPASVHAGIIDPDPGSSGSGSGGSSGSGSGGSSGSGSGGCPAGRICNPLQSTTITEFLVKIIQVLLIFAIPIVVFFIILAGFKFVTARGNDSKITEAKTALTWAVVGGVIVLGAQLINSRYYMQLVILSFLLVLPWSAFAVNVVPPTDLKSFLGILGGIIDILILLIFALTFLTISWGVINAWIIGDASSENVEKGKQVALVGVIALVVMSAIWGILKLLQQGIFG